MSLEGAPKERVLRLLVQMIVIEPIQTTFSVEGTKELTWAQRQLVIPVDRIKAFDFNAIAESLVHDAIESTTE